MHSRLQQFKNENSLICETLDKILKNKDEFDTSFCKIRYLIHDLKDRDLYDLLVKFYDKTGKYCDGSIKDNLPMNSGYFNFDNFLIKDDGFNFDSNQLIEDLYDGKNFNNLSFINKLNYTQCGNLQCSLLKQNPLIFEDFMPPESISKWFKFLYILNNSIEIENFRNIEKLKLNFEDVNIIWGENAQGKTNLIEAVYLFTGSKSFRGVKDSQLVKIGCEYSRLNIDFTSNGREQNAEILIKGKRHATLNGIKKRSAAELGNELKAVVFSPIHLSMIKDGPSERRKFIDNALCQLKSNYRNLLKEYNRALLQRNTLLKDLAKNPELDSMLYVWDGNLAKIGAKIVYQRLKYIEALKPFIKDIFSGISSGRENIDLIYSSCAEFDADLNIIEQNLLSAFESSKTADIINKTTTKGPHRDDIDILINDL